MSVRIKINELLSFVNNGILKIIEIVSKDIKSINKIIIFFNLLLHLLNIINNLVAFFIINVDTIVAETCIRNSNK